MKLEGLGRVTSRDCRAVGVKVAAAIASGANTFPRQRKKTNKAQPQGHLGSYECSE